MNYAPIILFVFKRLDHTKKVIDSLKNNPEAKESELYIFSDGPRNENDDLEVRQIRTFIREIHGFKEVHIIERNVNYGIEKQEIEAITQILKEYEMVIIIEDDIIVSSQFLKFMNEALITYMNVEEVFSVSGFSFLSNDDAKTINDKLYFLPIVSAWGWGVWRSSWEKFGMVQIELVLKHLRKWRVRKKFNFGYCYYNMLLQQWKNRNITWDMMWYISSFINGGLTLFPATTLVHNIGMDGTGVHFREDKKIAFEEFEVVEKFDFPKCICETKEVSKLVERVIKSN